MNVSRLFKYAMIIIATVILITFILPYNPEEIYSTQTVVDNIPSSISEKSPHKSPIDSNKAVNDSVRDSKKLFIILVTGFRTGSTFLGELMNQNEEVLYLFEPFHQGHIRALARDNAIHGVTEDDSLLEQRTAYLEQIFKNCEIQWPMFAGMSSTMKCGDSPEQNIMRFGTAECDKDKDKWNRACERRNMVALKLIRLQRIEHLALVPGIEDVNLKVIHLIRDPRGTMSSRLAFGTFYLDDIENLKINPLTPEKMKIAAANLCDREWDNIKYTENLPDWLKGRFMRITHDEMSLQPIESAQRVYDFLGKPIPSTMKEFLIAHTTTQEKGILNTSRNSTEVLEKWKSKMKLEIIRAIEETCKNVMDHMGYEPYQP